ncbi:MAG TPA: ribonuclease HI family protein [Candidatus Acidoferrales bacterium]|nr:ribonuclease HI family protein [Candidatus Acidoferrales bacterium]
MKLIANIDGASFGNPGASGLGIVLYNADGKVVKEHWENIGCGTNNRAEYMALLKSIDLAEELGADELEVRSDSLLVVSQVNGLYKIKNSTIKILAKQVYDKIKAAKMKFKIIHIPRELNKAADKLSKKGASFVKE